MAKTLAFAVCIFALTCAMGMAHASIGALQPTKVNASVEGAARTGKQASGFFPLQNEAPSAAPAEGVQEPQTFQGAEAVARDSYTYADASPKDFGYNTQHQHQQSYQPYPSPSGGYGGYPSSPSVAYGEDAGFDLDHFGQAGIGGLGGFLGLLGLKGLKGLGVVGVLKALAIPAILFLLPVLLILPILLLFLPIPMITVGNGNGKKRTSSSRSSLFGYTLPDISDKVGQISRAVMESEKCVERASCEISRYGRGSIWDRTLKRLLTKFESVIPNPWLRMARAYMDVHSCKRYGCYLMDDDKEQPDQFQKKI